MTQAAMPNSPAPVARHDDDARTIREMPFLLESKLKEWCTSLEPEHAKRNLARWEPMFIHAFPIGTAIVVDLKTGSIVHASTRTAALKLFISTFGAEAQGWTFDVGTPMNSGAGHCPR
jgi:hypothetical protein